MTDVNLLYEDPGAMGEEINYFVVYLLAYSFLCFFLCVHVFNLN